MNAFSEQKTTRIVFIGAPGCGKSTVSAELFVALKKLGKNAELVPEWVRRDIMKHGSMSNVFEQYRYLVHNRKEEDSFPKHVEAVGMCRYTELRSGCFKGVKIDGAYRIMVSSSR